MANAVASGCGIVRRRRAGGRIGHAHGSPERSPLGEIRRPVSVACLPARWQLSVIRTPHVSRSLRPRDLLLHATGTDIDWYVNEFLVRFCSAFLDQGYADWSLPDRELVPGPPGAVPPCQKSARPLAAVAQTRSDRVVAIASRRRTFDHRVARPAGHSAVAVRPFITETLLAMGGWAGRMWQMESSDDWTVRPAPHGSLIGFLAIRLIRGSGQQSAVSREP